MAKSTTREQEKAALEARFQALYEQLNPEQRQAVETLDGPVMVLAGPGTGKTQLLAMRIAAILRETQMDPWNILCVTFTESGTVAMRERLHSIIGEAAYYVRIHTFHSFCNEIIQEHPDVFARAAQWQPLSEVERLQWMEALLGSLPGTSPLKPFGSPYLYVRDVLGAIKTLKQEGVAPAAFDRLMGQIEELVREAEPAVAALVALKPKERTLEACTAAHEALLVAARELPAERAQLKRLYGRLSARLDTVETARAASALRTAYKSDVKKWFDRLQRLLPRQRELGHIYARYQERLTQDGRYDYEDMLMHVVEAWRADDALLGSYQEQFQYIMVDEYQDTNGAQNEILRLLGSFDSQPNICVVGDDKQSIYRFQGASLSNMVEFYERYRESAAVISLRENYRSQPTVLEAASGVIAHNAESLAEHINGVTQELVPRAERPARPLELVTVPSEAAEDFFVAEQIQVLLAEGTPPHEIAVLFRHHREGESLFQLLKQLNVPVRLESGEDALDDRLIRQLLMVLEHVAGPPAGGGGDERVAEMLQYEWLGIPALDALKLTHAAGRRQSLIAILSDPATLTQLGVAAPAAAQELIAHLAHWRQQAASVTPLKLIHTVVVESGFLAYVLAQPGRLGVLQKIMRVLDEARSFAREHQDGSLDDFLSSLKTLRAYGLGLSVHPWQVADEAVRLLTAHRAKGLEFEHVFIIRLNDTVWGNGRTAARLTLPAEVGLGQSAVATEALEDERRLFYVALTRARAGVVLLRAEYGATGRPTAPSLFWHEVPAGLTTTRELHEDAAEEEARLAHSFSPVIMSAETDGWLRERIQGLRLSATHVTNYLACPRRFYIENVLRVPRPPTLPQALGSALHGALEEWLRGHEGASAPAQAELLAAFRRRIEREVLTQRETADALAIGTERLNLYYQYLVENVPPVSLGEYDFSPHNVQLGDVPLTGRIDRVDVIDPERKLVRLVDYKSSKPESGSALVKPGGAYYQQLLFYMMLATRSPRFAYTVVEAEVHFLQPDRRGQFVRAAVTATADEVTAFEQEIQAVWQEIQALSFVTGTGRSFCGECEYCVSDQWERLRAASAGARAESRVQ